MATYILDIATVVTHGKATARSEAKAHSTTKHLLERDQSDIDNKASTSKASTRETKKKMSLFK